MRIDTDDLAGKTSESAPGTLAEITEAAASRVGDARVGDDGTAVLAEDPMPVLARVRRTGTTHLKH